MSRPTTGERLGAAIRRNYRAAGLTQTELAEVVGVSQSTVSGWITGDRGSPTVPQLVAIENACGAPAGHIMREAGLLPTDPRMPTGVAEPQRCRPSFTDAVRSAPVRLRDGREGHLWHFPSRPGYGRDQATVDIDGELVTVHVDDVALNDLEVVTDG